MYFRRRNRKNCWAGRKVEHRSENILQVLWKTEWTELAEYKAGQKLEYTIDVEGIPSGENEYTTETTKTTDETGTVTSFAIKSTHVPLTVAVPVQVVWNDGDNQDGVRPASVEATLYADDAATEKKVKLPMTEKY